MNNSRRTKDPSQKAFDFEAVKWPDHDSFPLNRKVGSSTVEDLIYQDIENSQHYLIITGIPRKKWTKYIRH